MPEGTDLFVTSNLAQQIGAQLQQIPEVVAYQTYVGTASPFNFNGLVRHYFLRQIRLGRAISPCSCWTRPIATRSSHDIARKSAPTLQPIVRAAGARLTIAEAPPGPPVLAPVVVELYGPTARDPSRGRNQDHGRP